MSRQGPAGLRAINHANATLQEFLADWIEQDDDTREQLADRLFRTEEVPAEEMSYLGEVAHAWAVEHDAPAEFTSYLTRMLVTARSRNLASEQVGATHDRAGARTTRRCERS